MGKWNKRGQVNTHIQGELCVSLWGRMSGGPTTRQDAITTGRQRTPVVRGITINKTDTWGSERPSRPSRERQQQSGLYLSKHTHVSPDSPQALGGQGSGTVPLNPTRALWCLAGSKACCRGAHSPGSRPEKPLHCGSPRGAGLMAQGSAPPSRLPALLANQQAARPPPKPSGPLWGPYCKQKQTAVNSLLHLLSPAGTRASSVALTGSYSKGRGKPTDHERQKGRPRARQTEEPWPLEQVPAPGRAQFRNRSQPSPGNPGSVFPSLRNTCCYRWIWKNANEGW